MYGCGYTENFLWPSLEDLKKMVQNMPTKIIDFKHKTSTWNSGCFGAFQVVLSNGIASPVMKGKS
jgi:hypothetical protein